MFDQTDEGGHQIHRLPKRKVISIRTPQGRAGDGTFYLAQGLMKKSRRLKNDGT